MLIQKRVRRATKQIITSLLLMRIALQLARTMKQELLKFSQELQRMSQHSVCILKRAMLSRK